MTSRSRSEVALADAAFIVPVGTAACWFAPRRAVNLPRIAKFALPPESGERAPTTGVAGIRVGTRPGAPGRPGIPGPLGDRPAPRSSRLHQGVDGTPGDRERPPTGPGAVAWLLSSGTNRSGPVKLKIEARLACNAPLKSCMLSVMCSMRPVLELPIPVGRLSERCSSGGTSPARRLRM